MRRRFSRRDFVVTGAAAGVAAASPRALFGRAPAVNAGGAARPIVIAPANGNWWKNGGTVTCVEKAWTLMRRGRESGGHISEP